MPGGVGAVLTVPNAKDASLKAIVEDLGRRMDIEVDAQNTEDEKVIEQFNRLPLEDVLKRLRANCACLQNSEKEEGKITMPYDDLVKPGENLFESGTFNGNGRTCETCHPATNNFSINPS
jgi:hypothetical protein